MVNFKRNNVADMARRLEKDVLKHESTLWLNQVPPKPTKPQDPPLIVYQQQDKYAVAVTSVMLRLLMSDRSSWGDQIKRLIVYTSEAFREELLKIVGELDKQVLNDEALEETSFAKEKQKNCQRHTELGHVADKQCYTFKLETTSETKRYIEGLSYLLRDSIQDFYGLRITIKCQQKSLLLCINADTVDADSREAFRSRVTRCVAFVHFIVTNPQADLVSMNLTRERIQNILAQIHQELAHSFTWGDEEELFDWVLNRQQRLATPPKEVEQISNSYTTARRNSSVTNMFETPGVEQSFIRPRKVESDSYTCKVYAEYLQTVAGSFEDAVDASTVTRP